MPIEELREIIHDHLAKSDKNIFIEVTTDPLSVDFDFEKRILINQSPTYSFVKLREFLPEMNLPKDKFMEYYNSLIEWAKSNDCLIIDGSVFDFNSSSAIVRSLLNSRLERDKFDELSQLRISPDKEILKKQIEWRSLHQ